MRVGLPHHSGVSGHLIWLNARESVSSPATTPIIILMVLQLLSSYVYGSLGSFSTIPLQYNAISSNNTLYRSPGQRSTMQAEYIEEGLACSGMPITTSTSNRESNLIKNMAANGATAIAILIFFIMGMATSTEIKEGEACQMMFIYQSM